MSVDAIPPALPGRKGRFAIIRQPRMFAVLALLFVATGFVWTRHAGPEPRAWYPPCPLHATTGVLCPGCGSARVLHDLAHGDLRSACAHNILIIAAIPFLAAWALVSFWRAIRHNLPPLRAPSGAARIVLIVVVVFWVARNLPWHPFTLLTP